MADAKTEKKKVKEITDKLEEGLKELFESEKYKNYLSTVCHSKAADSRRGAVACGEGEMALLHGQEHPRKRKI